MRTHETKDTRNRAETRRAFALHAFKATNDNAGTFEGYVACFSNLDHNGDIIDRGAFRKTLHEHAEIKSRNNSPYLFPILWQHDEHDPIGGFTDAYEDDHGLHVRGELDLEVPNGARAYSALKRGYIRGLSIAFDAVKTVWDQKRARHLTEIRLYEGSPVTFPANEEAMVLSVKSAASKADWPLAPREYTWDAAAAHARLVEWAGGEKALDVDKFKSVHFWSPEGDAAANPSEYKFAFCDIIDGSPKAVYNALPVAGTGGEVSGDWGVDVEAVKTQMGAYYRKMAGEFKDASIKPPWDTTDAGSAPTEAKTITEIKQLGGLQALTTCAVELGYVSKASAGLIETLAGACGMSVAGPETSVPAPPVAALLGAVDGLPEAVQAMLTAWQDFDAQASSLLGILGIPEDSGYGMSNGYMEELRSALELKEGRPLSSANRQRIQKVADGLQGHSEELKSLLKDTGKVNENDQDLNIDQQIAAGKKTGRPALFALEAYRRGVGQKPGNTDTTSSPANPEPEAATLEQFEAMLLESELDLLQRQVRQHTAKGRSE